MSPPPDRGRTRSHDGSDRAPSYPRSRYPQRSISPRSISRSRLSSQAGSPREGRRNGNHRDESHNRGRTRSRSVSLDRDGQRDGGRSRNRGRSMSLDKDLESGPVSSKVVIEKLTKNVTEAHLREIFGNYGSIQDLDMPVNRQFMTNRGTAYIVYHTSSDAETAIAHMHEAQLDGALINVSIVLPRRKFSPSPMPARRLGPGYDRDGPRTAPSRGGFRGPPPPPPPLASIGGPGPGRYRSPSYRRSPPRRYGRPDARGRDFDTYRPRSYSRSLSPRSARSRSRSYTSRSRSRSPPPRRRYIGGRPRRDSPPRGQGRQRSLSYSSYSSYSDRSRSPNRGNRRR